MNRDSDSDLYSQTTNWLVGTAKRRRAYCCSPPDAPCCCGARARGHQA